MSKAGLKSKLDPTRKGCQLCFRTGKAIVGTPYTCPNCKGCCCVCKCSACEGRKYLLKDKDTAQCGLCKGEGTLKKTKKEMGKQAEKAVVKALAAAAGGMDLDVPDINITGDFAMLEVCESVPDEAGEIVNTVQEVKDVVDDAKEAKQVYAQYKEKKKFLDEVKAIEKAKKGGGGCVIL